MSNQTDQDNAAIAGHEAAGIRLRIRPAVLIALAHLAAAYAFSTFGSTNIQSAVALGGVPLAAALLLIIWWLAASRAPLRDRVIGLVVFLAAVALVVFSQKTLAMGGMLLARAMPAMTLGVVGALLVTHFMGWRVRRWLLAAFLLGCAGVFCAMRVDSIGGTLAPVVSWRWQPTAEERSKALPIPEAHGTAILPAQAGPEDWPAFRGAARDGHRAGVKFSTDWGTPPREVWRRKIGPAWSSFIAVGDYLFTQEQRGAEELVTCYRAETGDLVWQNRVEARFEDTMGLGPRATPTFVDGKLYTQGGTGALQCLDASTGETIWKRDLTKDAETRVPGYGFASSPLVVGDLVIEFSCGGEGKNVVAYHRATGDLAWRAGHGTPGYSSPHHAVLSGVPQVLMVTNLGIQSFVPETGAVLWEFQAGVKTNPRCTQPLVVDGNRVMLGTTGTMGSYLLQVGPKSIRINEAENNAVAWEVSQVWMTRKFRPYFNDCVLHKGFCYGFDGERLACMDIETGERRWGGKLYGGQLLLLVDMDLLLVLSEAGDVILVPAAPDRFTEAARFKALTGKTWNHPVVAHGRLYIRNSEEAACFELPGSRDVLQTQ